MLINAISDEASKEISKQKEAFFKSEIIRILKNNFPKTDFDKMADEDIVLFMVNNNLEVTCDSSDVKYSMIDKYTFSVKQTLKDVKVFQTIKRELK